jgi:hypothetical protein
MKYLFILCLPLALMFGCSPSQLQTANAVLSPSQLQKDGAAAFGTMIDEFSKDNPDPNVIKANGLALKDTLNVLGVTDSNLAIDIFFKGMAVAKNKAEQQAVINRLIEWVALNPGVTTALGGGYGGLIYFAAMALLGRKKKK